MPIPRFADVVVVGGGVVGLSTAWELAQRGVSVVVLEKGSVGGEQSGRNWGYVRQQARHEAELPLAVAANRTWAGLEHRLGVDIEWAQRGNLQLIHTPEDLAWYTEWASLGQAHGVPTEMLSDDRVHELLPQVRATFLGAMFTPSDGQVNPLKATRAIARAAEQTGATVLEGVTALGAVVQQHRVIGVRTDEGVISCAQLVVASGVWSRSFLRTVGVDLPLQRIRATVAKTDPLPSFPHIPSTNWTNRVSVRNTADGALMVAIGGATDIDIMPSALNHLGLFTPTLKNNLRMFRLRVGRPLVEDLARYVVPGRRYVAGEPPVSRSNVRRSRELLMEMFPQADGLTIRRAWAGIIDGSPDSLPVVSRVPGIQGLVVGACFSGHGFALGPSAGVALADLVVSSASSTFDLHPFRLERFTERRSSATVRVGR